MYVCYEAQKIILLIRYSSLDTKFSWFLGHYLKINATYFLRYDIHVHMCKRKWEYYIACCDNMCVVGMIIVKGNNVNS